MNESQNQKFTKVSMQKLPKICAFFTCTIFRAALNPDDLTADMDLGIEGFSAMKPYVLPIQRHVCAGKCALLGSEPGDAPPLTYIPNPLTHFYFAT